MDVEKFRDVVRICLEAIERAESRGDGLFPSKNKYAERTKLSEAQFEIIMRGFCKGLTATETAVLLKGQGLAASRPTVEHLYIRLGNRCYEFWCKSLIVQLARNDNPQAKDMTDDEVAERCLRTLWRQMTGELNFKEFRDKNLTYPAPDIVISILKSRWKRLNGFPKKNFQQHVGYATYRMLVREDEDLMYDGLRMCLCCYPLKDQSARAYRQ
jgi:hypothetical protein